MLTHQLSICRISINLHGIIPSLEVENELTLIDSGAQFEIYEVSHCDGLLLCTDPSSRLVVWNPLTGQTKWIKDVEGKKNHSYVLGYYQEKKYYSKSYKILSISNDAKNVMEIYEFRSDSWRVLDHQDIATGWSITSFSPTVSLKGNAYLVGTTGHISLLRFDFSTEKSSGCVPLPYPCSGSENLNLSVVREEKLSLLLQCKVNYSKTEIWVTNKIDETKAVLWSKVLALDLSRDLQISDLGRFLLDQEKKVLVLCERWIDHNDDTVSKDMIYIVGEDNKVTQVNVGVDTILGSWPLILNYVPSLVQIEKALGNNKRRRGDYITRLIQ